MNHLLGLQSSRACKKSSDVDEATKALHPFQQGLSFFRSFVEKSVGDGNGAKTMEDLKQWIQDTSHSSAFSGIGSPETALLSLHLTVQALLPDIKVAALFHSSTKPGHVLRMYPGCEHRVVGLR